MQSRNDVDLLWHTVNSYCTQIENTVKNFSRLIQQQQQQQHHSPDNDITGDLSGRSPGVLSAVPSSIPSQLPTLLFTTETKQVFLRTALTRELFQYLKRISKRWLANVPEEQRRQATKVAQSIAKAVTDYRISCITEKDIATYRTHIQQSFGREYNIPTEQIRAAFSQKIRVFLQNTKASHPKWIKKYEGKYDINAPMVMIECAGHGGAKPEVEEPQLPKQEIQEDHTYNSFPPLRDPETGGNEHHDVLGDFQSLPYKRSLDTLGVQDENVKRSAKAMIQQHFGGNFPPDGMFSVNPVNDVSLSGNVPQQNHDPNKPPM